LVTQALGAAKGFRPVRLFQGSSRQCTPVHRRPEAAQKFLLVWLAPQTKIISYGSSTFGPSASRKNKPTPAAMTSQGKVADRHRELYIMYIFIFYKKVRAVL